MSKKHADGFDFSTDHAKEFGFHGSMEGKGHGRHTQETGHMGPHHLSHGGKDDHNAYAEGGTVERGGKARTTPEHESGAGNKSNLDRRGGSEHFAGGGHAHVHPHGHEVVHAEHRDGAVVHHHAHGGCTMYHAHGGITHHNAEGEKLGFPPEPGGDGMGGYHGHETHLAGGGQAHHHPHGHHVTHHENHGDAMVHHHAHGGFTVHHADGATTHHDQHGELAVPFNRSHENTAHGHQTIKEASPKPGFTDKTDDSEGNLSHEGSHPEGNYHRGGASHREGGRHGHSGTGNFPAGDEAQDKRLIKRAISQHDQHLHGGAKEHLALRKGGAMPGGRMPRANKPVAHQGIDTPASAMPGNDFIAKNAGPQNDGMSGLTADSHMPDFSGMNKGGVKRH